MRTSSAACRLLIFVMLSALAVAERAEALEGRVVDRLTGNVVAGAEVGIAGLPGTVRTDRNGTFVWAPNPPLPFTVIVILPNGRLARPVRVTALSASTLMVPIDPAVIENMVIAGSAPSIDAAPGTSSTLVPSADIARRAPANLLQALEHVAGVGGVAEGQGSVPAIRGLARGRTLLLVDGSRLFSERRAGPSVSFLAPDNLDRIDVVRGPASVAYGSDAFGGVISLITARPAAGAPLTARLSSTFGAGVPAERYEAQVAAGLGARAGFIAHARKRESEDYSSPDDVVPNSAWRDEGVLVRAGINAGGWWTAGWQGDYVRNSGLPRSDSQTLLVSLPFERSTRGSISFDRSAVPWIGHVSVGGLFSRYEQRLDQDRLAAPGRPRRVDRADIDGTDVELRAQSRRAIGSARLLTGVSVTDRHGLHAHDIALIFNAAGALTSTVDVASIASARKRNIGVFAQIDAPLASRLTMTAGARFDRVRSVNIGGFFGDRAVSHRAFSGSVSLAYRPWTPVTLAGQVSRGFRDPTLSDRFFRGPVGRGFIVGNPDLGPERSVQFDVTVQYDAKRWRLGAAYYRYNISDLIERYQSGTDTFLFRNRGLAEIRGVELEGSLTLSGGLTIEASGQAGRGRAADNGAALDDVGPARAILQLRQEFGTRVLVAARVAAIDRDSAPGPSEVETPGYMDAGATATWRVTRWLDLRAASANLLNQRYYSSPSSRGVLAPGRYASVTAVIRLR